MRFVREIVHPSLALALLTAAGLTQSSPPAAFAASRPHLISGIAADGPKGAATQPLWRPDAAARAPLATSADAASDGSPTAVPEPSTLLLVGTGLLGLGITVRRRVRVRPQ